MAKGYTHNFFSDVKEGRLTGQKGEPGTPGSLTLVGVVSGGQNPRISGATDFSGLKNALAPT